jgi:hypothetical protein
MPFGRIRAAKSFVEYLGRRVSTVVDVRVRFLEWLVAAGTPAERGVARIVGETAETVTGRHAAAVIVRSLRTSCQMRCLTRYLLFIVAVP